MRQYYVHWVMIAALIIGIASPSIVNAKGVLSVAPQPTSGWRPVPCEVMVCGNTTTYSNCNWSGTSGTPESGAREFFKTFGPALRIDESQLRTLEVKSGLTSINMRFEQVYENRRVFGALVAVISDQGGRIRKVHTSYFPIERILGSGVPTVTAGAAETIGLAAIGKPAGGLPQLRLPTRSELVWFPIAGTQVVLLAWELMIHGQTPFLGDFLTLVEANSGVLLHQEDRLATGN